MAGPPPFPSSFALILPTPSQTKTSASKLQATSSSTPNSITSPPTSPSSPPPLHARPHPALRRPDGRRESSRTRFRPPRPPTPLSTMHASLYSYLLPPLANFLHTLFLSGLDAKPPEDARSASTSSSSSRKATLASSRRRRTSTSTHNSTNSHKPVYLSCARSEPAEDRQPRRRGATGRRTPSCTCSRSSTTFTSNPVHFISL